MFNTEWMEAVLKPLGGSVLESTEEVAKAIVLGNVEEGKFPLKMRDEAISAGFALLRSKGLVIDDDSDDENYAEAAGGFREEGRLLIYWCPSNWVSARM